MDLIVSVGQNRVRRSYDFDEALQWLAKVVHAGTSQLMDSLRL